MAEYQTADPDTRRRAVIYLLVAAIIGVISIAFYRNLLESAGSDPELLAERLTLIVSSLYVLVLPAIWFALRVNRVARLTHESGRYPPPGMAVVRDTRIVTGGDATRRAWAARIVAVLVVVSSVLTPTVLLMLVRAVMGRAPNIGV